MPTVGSQATFGSSTKKAVRERFGNRCAICLTKLTAAGGRATHISDSAGVGTIQLEFATALGLLPQNYRKSSAADGMVQCASCHLGLFKQSRIALSLPRPILQYIKDYLTTTNPADRMPLHKLLRSMIRAAERPIVGLPSTALIRPYLGLYSLVPLKQSELHGLEIPTLLLPNLSIVQQGRFVPAPAGTSPTASNVARIFDVLAATDSQATRRPGGIPLSSFHAEFAERRCWRLPVNPEVVLSTLMYRVSSLPPRLDCEEIELTQIIHGMLVLGRAGVNIGGRPEPESDSDQAGRKRKSDDPNDDSPPSKRYRPSQSEVGGSSIVGMVGWSSDDLSDLDDLVEICQSSPSI